MTGRGGEGSGVVEGCGGKTCEVQGLAGGRGRAGGRAQSLETRRESEGTGKVQGGRGTIATGGQSRCGKVPGATLGKRVTDGDSNTLFPPLLEETHALAPAVGPPQVAPAGGVVAAVVGAVVTGTSAADAGPPKKVDVGGTSEQTIRKGKGKNGRM